MMSDTRLVQTAVLGSPDSDTPVILPTDHRDLDLFRAHHANAQFWCGLLLGGCGRELVTKRYADRLCHFAHLADPNQGPSACSRDATSADHLYVKAAVHTWLTEHGTRSEARLVGADRRDVEFTAERLRLRVQLTALDTGQVRSEQERAADDGLELVWIVGDDPHISVEITGVGPTALRITCETVGSSTPTRRVFIGRRDRAGRTTWTALNDCVPAAAGTPTPPQDPGYAPRTVQQSPVPETGLANLPGQQMVADAAARRLAAAVANWAHTPDTLVRLIQDASAELATLTNSDARLQLQVAIGDAQQALEQAQARREARETAAKARPAPPLPAVPDYIWRKQRPLPVRIQPKRTTPATPSPPRARPTPADPSAPPRLRLSAEYRDLADRYAPQIRDELIRCVRAHKTMTWSELWAKYGHPALPQLTTEALAAVMAVVDETTLGTEPLLSALLAVGDPERCREPFNMAAGWLARPRDAQQQVERLYEIWQRQP